MTKKDVLKMERIIDLNKKVYFRKARQEHAGEVGEVDACKDYWLGSVQSHLHACYDPATRTITSLHIEKEETTHGYYKLLETLILKGTVPKLFKGDCRSTFVINKKDAGALAHKDVNTQFGFVLNQLDVKMENSSEPTFKGGIERFFRTAQNQLKGELRERGITDFETANEYLEEYKIQFNKQYSIKPIKSERHFVEIKMTKKEINELLSIRSFRKTDKANSISYKNELLSLYDKNNNRLAFKEKSVILILETLNGQRIGRYLGEQIKLKPTDFKYLTGSQKEQYKSMRQLTPSFSSDNYHPWGYNVFLLYLNKTNNLKRYLRK